MFSNIFITIVKHNVWCSQLEANREEAAVTSEKINKSNDYFFEGSPYPEVRSDEEERRDNTAVIIKFSHYGVQVSGRRTPRSVSDVQGSKKATPIICLLPKIHVSLSVEKGKTLTCTHFRETSGHNN